MTFSGGKAYLEDSDGNRCYFPLPGARSLASSPQDFYWSSGWEGDAYARSTAPQLILTERNANYYTHNLDLRGLSVRCVRQGF